MKVILKYGHHNCDRFYHAGEILDCDKKLFHLLVKQGLAIPVKEESPKKKADLKPKTGKIPVKRIKTMNSRITEQMSQVRRMCQMWQKRRKGKRRNNVQHTA